MAAREWREGDPLDAEEIQRVREHLRRISLRPEDGSPMYDDVEACEASWLATYDILLSENATLRAALCNVSQERDGLRSQVAILEGQVEMMSASAAVARARKDI